MALGYAVSKGCSLIDKGNEVFIEDLPATELPCVRPKGKSACFWVNRTLRATD